MWNSNDILTSQKLNEMEGFISSKSISYSKTTWQDEDIVTADKLNNLENGVLLSNSSYSNHTWVNDEEITAVKLNNITGGLNFEVGDEIVKDGITSVCVYKADTRQDWGQYLFVDKNHDLCYYIDGDDYINEQDLENQSINSEFKYGYEWCGEGIETGINSQAIGEGLSNTNSLIDLNLQPSILDWSSLWSMVDQFRIFHSRDWFVPTGYELQEIYNQRSLLSNLSLTKYPFYWSSSDYDLSTARIFIFGFGGLNSYSKSSHSVRARLCFYL